MPSHEFERLWAEFYNELRIHVGSDKLGPPYDFILCMLQAAEQDPPTIAWTSEDEEELGNFWSDAGESFPLRRHSERDAAEHGIPRLMLELILPA